MINLKTLPLRAAAALALSFAVLAASVTWNPASAQAARTPVKITIGVGGFSFAFLSVLTADVAKLFAQENLEVTLINTGGGTNTMAALLGGSVELGGVVMSDAILAATKGQKVQTVAPLLTQFASDAVISKSAAAKAGITPGMPLLERIKRLKGMTLAITGRGSGADKMWRYLLELAGMDPDRDVTLTVVRLDQMYAALRAGQIDGFNASAPSNNRAVQEGLAVWAARPSQGEVPGLTDFLYTSIAAKPAYIAANNDTIARVVRALQKANVLIQDDPVRVAKLLHPVYFSQTDYGLLEETVKDQKGGFSKRMTLSVQAFDQNVKFMTRFGDNVKSVQFADVIEPKFVAALR